MIRLHTLVSILCIAVVASPANLFAQFGTSTASRDPRVQRARREQAVASVGPIARDLVEAHGEEAVAALFACSKPVAMKLAQFHASGELGRLPRPRDLLVVIAMPGCGDDVALWALGHAAELGDRDNFDAYLMSPLVYALELKKLATGAAEVRARRLHQAAIAVRQVPASPMANGWEQLAPETKLCITGGVFLIGAAVIVMWRRRQAAGW